MTLGQVRLQLSDQVEIVLTDEGRSVYAESVRALWTRPAPIPDDGRIRMALWDVMHTFGPHCMIGSPELFTDLTLAEQN